ncbi:hypothetical protein BGZ96_004108 [Linnemannia gamsii]|uniref:Secreted protein n=1 Tax=Linnemannia gamsii TaxID=64522 RepID=A0ABQ7K8Y7_9FUNG|nr:hypothetical protein BGZ96_004108 [Linnemannia gamsii]
MHFHGLALLIGASLLMTLTNAKTISCLPCVKEEGVGAIAKNLHCDPSRMIDYGYQQLDNEGNWEAPVETRCIVPESSPRKIKDAKVSPAIEFVPIPIMRSLKSSTILDPSVGGRGRCLFSVQDIV